MKVWESIKGFWNNNSTVIIIVAIIILLLVVSISFGKSYLEKKKFGGVKKDEFITNMVRGFVTDKERSIKELDQNYLNNTNEGKPIGGIFQWYANNAESNNGQGITVEMVRNYLRLKKLDINLAEQILTDAQNEYISQMYDLAEKYKGQ